MSHLIYTIAKEKFGVADQRKKGEEVKIQPNRREMKIRKLRGELKQLRKAFKTANNVEKAGLKDLRDQHRKEKSHLFGKQNELGYESAIQQRKGLPPLQTPTSFRDNYLKMSDPDISVTTFKKLKTTYMLSMRNHSETNPSVIAEDSCQKKLLKPHLTQKSHHWQKSVKW